MSSDDTLFQAARAKQRANDALARGEGAAAREALAEAFRLDPRDDDAAMLGAMLAHDAGALEEAARLAAAAIRLRPCHPAAFNLLGVVCIDAGRGRLAEKLLRHARAIAPGFRGARANLKTARRARGDEPTAGGAIWRELAALVEEREPWATACILALPGEGAAAVETARSAREHGLAVVALLAGESRDARVAADDADALDAAAAADGAIHVHRLARGGDAATCWNRAMDLADGEWLLLLRAGETLPAAGNDAEGGSDIAPPHDRLWGVVAVRLATEARGAARLEPRWIRNAPGLRHRGRGFPDLRGRLLAAARAWGLDGATLDLEIATPARGAAGIWPDLGSAARPDADARADELAWADAWLEREPEEWTVRLTRARLRLEEGDATAALADARACREALETIRGGGFADETVVLEGRCLAALEDWEALDAWARRNGAREAPNADAAFLEGLAAKALGDAGRAADRLRRAIALRDAPRHGPSLPALSGAGAGAEILLGAAALDAGDLDGAEAAFDAALERAPDDAQAVLGRAAVRLARGRHEECLRDLDALVAAHGDDPESWIAGGALLARIPGLDDVAVGWFDEAARRHPASAALARARAEALVRCGRGDRALACLAGVEPAGSRDLGARVAAALSAGLPLPDVPADQAPAVIDETLDWCGRWAAHRAWTALDRALTEIHRAEPALPGLGRAAATWLDARGQGEAAAQLLARLPAGRSGDGDAR